ncbi:MAG TPA: cytochrome c family protein [Nitrospirota bacterium]
MRLIHAAVISLILLTTNYALAADPSPAPAQATGYEDATKHHDRATPVWVLPKATAPSNMDWTTPDMPKSHAANQFYGPMICAGCHRDIFNQWKGSMMAAAWKDPVFRAVYFKYVKDAKTENEKAEVAMCSRCHTPVGYVADNMGRYAPGTELSDPEAAGVQCEVCHTVAKSAGIANGAWLLDPGNAAENVPGTKYGPRKDSVSGFHKTQYGELHTRSDFCGMCHDVNHAHNYMAIENTYSEWRNSPYNTGDPNTTTFCQDCHMRQTPENPATGSTEKLDIPGTAAVGGKKREHVWQHNFVGGNLAVTALLGAHPHAKMAEDRLKHAAKVEYTGGGKAAAGEIFHLPVKVTNNGAGHYLPTGLTFVREMWLDVTVKDAAGNEIYRSGELDGQGNLKPGAVIYRSVLGKEGKEMKPTLFLPEATQVIEDHRIRPQGYVMEDFSFVIPADAKPPLKYHVEMRYRSAPQFVVNDLLGKGAPVLPIFDMGEAEGVIEIVPAAAKK